jgi:DUF4097 and DUF4098 domain-containing protein YvlB
MRSQEAEASEQFSVPRQAIDAVQVATPCGDVRVLGVDSEQIEVRVVRRVRAAREEEARAFLDLMRVERRLEGDRYVVEASWPEARHHRVESPQTRFELRLPAGMVLEAGTGHGTVEVNEVGSARLRSGSGDLVARGVAGGLEARTGHGSVRIEQCGALVAETGSGDIQVRLAGSSVQASTGHGALTVEECGGPAELSAKSGDIRARTVKGRLEAVSGHGRIEVMGTTETRLRTNSGDIHACLVSGSLEARTGHGRITLEDSDGPATCETNSGDILVERLTGDVTASTGHGSIRVGDAGAASLRSGSGDVHVLRAAGPVTARTGHGRICIDDCPGPIEADTRSGEIELRDAGADVRARTGHGSMMVALSPDAGTPQLELGGCGSVELSLPRAVSAHLEAHTSAGVIESSPIEGARIDPRRSHLEAVLGSGEGSIQVRTNHGSIRIRLLDSADAPRTATAPV